MLHYSISAHQLVSRMIGSHELLHSEYDDCSNQSSHPSHSYFRWHLFIPSFHLNTQHALNTLDMLWSEKTAKAYFLHLSVQICNLNIRSLHKGIPPIPPGNILSRYQADHWSLQCNKNDKKITHKGVSWTGHWANPGGLGGISSSCGCCLGLAWDAYFPISSRRMVHHDAPLYFVFVYL